jgi:hypothetical protein
VVVRRCSVHVHVHVNVHVHVRFVQKKKPVRQLTHGLLIYIKTRLTTVVQEHDISATVAVAVDDLCNRLGP